MNPIVQQFMEATYPQACSRSPQNEGAPQPPLELAMEGERTLIPLPPHNALQLPAIDLREAIERRRTLRRYSDQPLILEELSYLLWLTQGVKEVTSRPATLRTVPSAGARHAFETYLLINAVKGLEPGLYRFAAGQHALARTVTHGCGAEGGIRAEITRACGDQQQVATSAATFIWVAVAARMTWRYVERGYRYLHLDAGHVCQNLYLAAEALACGVCAIAAYDDARLNTALDLDGQEQFVIYLASLGKR
jgi:SagB-type dehydrogenase family enzyme